MAIKEKSGLRLKMELYCRTKGISEPDDFDRLADFVSWAEEYESNKNKDGT